MLVIDELHNLLAASNPRQRELLNLLRYLGNELRIPLACLGTREAYLAIRTDDQLENRFEPFLLPSWEDGPEFGRLLASFEAVLPLREPSGLGLPAMRAMILQRSEGTIGEVAALLAAATETALSAAWSRSTRIRSKRPRISRRRCADACSNARCDERHSVDLMTNRRWPLHPQPSEWEDLETWVRRIADTYGVSYDAFLLNALDHTGRGARDLDQAPDRRHRKIIDRHGSLDRTAAGHDDHTVMARLVSQTQAWLETAEGQVARDSLIAMGSRNRRRDVGGAWILIANRNHITYS